MKGAAKDCALAGTANAGLGTGHSDTVYRLKEGVERFLITGINNPAGSSKAQSDLWVMIGLFTNEPTTDQNVPSIVAFNHLPGGCNVLFMDGHVQFMKYSFEGEFPCNFQLAHYFVNTAIPERQARAYIGEGVLPSASWSIFVRTE